ncbi:MAG: phosphate--acyl-ACP acyltransferase, partial [Christensenellales bacterium]
LLNIGVEENKGNELTKETYKLLKQLPINFVGNFEARDFLSGNADVVITDAFSGNVLLKGTEGAVMMVLESLKTEIKNSFLCKIGALFMKKAFKNLKAKLKTDNHGGSVMLGLKKTLIKVHGASSHVAFEVAIKQAIDMTENKVLEKFEEEFNSQVEKEI